MESENHIQHDLPCEKDSIDFAKIQQTLLALTRSEFERFTHKIKPEETRGICSKSSETSVDISIYEGATGYLGLYVKLLMAAEKFKNSKSLSKFAPAFEKLTQELPLLGNNSKLLEIATISVKSLETYAAEALRYKKLRISCSMGPAGFYVYAAIVAYYQNDSKAFIGWVDMLVDLKKYITGGKMTFPMEFLYGVAGYLYGLLAIQGLFSETAVEGFKVNLQGDIAELVELLIAQGLKDYGKEVDFEKPPKDFRLVYYFHEKEYIGGVHGLAGVLYMILTAYQQNKAYFDSKHSALATKLKLACKASLQFLISIQLPSGNFPSSIKRLKEDSLVQMCHGAPGVVQALLKGTEVFPTDSISESLFDAAIKAGELVWQRGLLKKGFGLCHGISGNGYTFLSLFKYTKNEKWLMRAYQFALVKNDKNIMKTISSYDPGNRLVKGTPDYPYSLMLGLAGDLCYYLDILDPESAKIKSDSIMIPMEIPIGLAYY